MIFLMAQFIFWFKKSGKI